MDRAALDAAYNNSAAVAGSGAIVEAWTRRSAELRSRFAGTLDLRYGSEERNRVDFFEASPGAPVLAFIHGGYWQMRAKENFAFVAEGPLARGISVAMIGYTLAPAKRLRAIVDEIASALSFLQQRFASSLLISGWSAGGHLTAMAMRHPAVRAGLAISGIYDLEPMKLSYINEKLRLDDDEVQALSPLRLAKPAKSLAIAYGARELSELQRQSEAYAAAIATQPHALAGHDHFSILEELASPEGELTLLARTLLGK